MGHIPKRLTAEQKTILDYIAKSERLTPQFYFTGETALSSFYLGHRESVDLDFFSQKQFGKELVEVSIAELITQFDLRIESEFIDPLYRFLIIFPTKNQVKVDFSYYPYPHIGKFLKYEKIYVDSELDIAANKLQSITSRHEVKDFVDLFFLLKKFTFWDLREGVRIKFRNDIEPFIVASDFLAVEDFTFLPTMHVPLKLNELKKFFRELATQLGKTHVE